MNGISAKLGVVVVGLLTGIGSLSAQEAGTPSPVDLDAPDRAAADRERDAHSHPIEMFRWVGVEPGDVVVDYHAGGGYNTWILSEWVGPEGVVFTEMSGPRGEALVERLGSGDLADADNVVHVTALEQVPEDSVDMVLTVRNYHDLEPAEVPGFLADVQRILVPGGTFVVVDARAEEGRDEEAHRIADLVIIEEITDAGFELVESSELLANPEDDHAGPDWENRTALDQSLIKFRAPGGDDGEPMEDESYR